MSFPINLFLTYLLLFPIIFLHELGHALAAKIVGFRVFSITIGRGRQVLEFGVLGIPIRVNRYPSFGLTLAAPQRRERVKLFMWFYVFGGPAVHLLIAVLCIWLLSERISPKIYIPEFFERVSLLEPLFLANLWLLVFSIIPRQIKSVGLGLHTDGSQLLRIPFADSTEFDRIIAYIPKMEAAEYLRLGDYGKAIDMYEKLHASDPSDILLGHDLAVARLYFGNYDEARVIFNEILNSGEVKKPAMELLLKNNIAWINAVLNRPELLEQASMFSYEVNRLRPKWEYAIGTRGAVLVRRGDLDKGIEYLARSYRLHSERSSRSSCACFIAIAKAQKQDFVNAEKWLQIAKKENGANHLIKIAEAELLNLKEKIVVS